MCTWSQRFIVKHLDSNINHFFTHLYDLCFDVESNDGFSIIIPQKIFIFFKWHAKEFKMQHIKKKL